MAERLRPDVRARPRSLRVGGSQRGAGGSPEGTRSRGRPGACRPLGREPSCSNHALVNTILLSGSSVPATFQPSFQGKASSPATKCLVACQNSSLNATSSNALLSWLPMVASVASAVLPVWSQEPDFAPGMPEFSHQLLGGVPPVLQNCLMVCLTVTLAVHPTSSTNTLRCRGLTGIFPFPSKR